MRKRTPKQFGNYQRVRVLRSGGEAIVYIGRHIHTGELVAIRILLMHGNTDAVRRHFLGEVENLRKLKHPYIIPLKEYGITQGYAYLVMPFVSDGSLGELVRKGRQFTLDEVLECLQQAAEALSYAHANGITHRDVKPDNLLRGSNGILLSDFGISRHQDATKTMVRGTPHFCPPEQWAGNPEPASDQYALAVTACWLLTGMFPENGGQELLLSKYPDIALVLERALQKDPGLRYQSMTLFATALGHTALTGRPGLVELLPPKHHIDPRPPRPRPPLLIAAVLGVVLLVALTLGGWSLIQLGHSTPPASLPVTFCIGTDFPTSGTEAIHDVPLRNGADLAIALNQNLSLGYTLNACDMNDVSPITGIHDSATGVQNIHQLIDNKTVVGLVGPANSNVAQAEIPIAAQADLPMVSPNTTDPCLTLQQYCANPGEVHPPGVPNSFFRICSNDLRQGQADADLLFKTLGLQAAFVVDDSEVYGQGLANAFITQYKNDRGTILGHNHILNGDISAQLVQSIISSKPDAVFYAGTTANGGGRLKAQLAQAGFTGPLVGGDGIALHEQYLSDAGSAADNTYATALGPDSSTFPQWYTQAYQNHYGAMPSQDSAGNYDAAMVLITAIKSLIKTNPQVMHSGNVGAIHRAIREEVRLPQQPYSGLTGIITFDSNGDNAATKLFTVYAVENGHWIYKPEDTVTISG